ncbi:DNA-processing protein DprA [Burkholderia anthinoferrum]|uniref:DNA-processing protein DprA n=1 Tax=Burkholderia anthinoferrum TaxID=3090833 RepID=UPI000CE1BA83|nr:DNA-processing protein DprA [Burkholderia anthinoferrum]
MSAIEFDSLLSAPPVDQRREMGAYEWLWNSERASFKSLAETFRQNPGLTPAEIVEDELIDSTLEQVDRELVAAKVHDLNFCVHQTADYPPKLRDAEHPLEFFYYRGWLDLAYSPRSVAVVGTRNPSEDGIRRAKRLVRLLVEHDVTIYSGLAKGIDTIAHTTAIACGGRTVAVVGTPVTEVYPRENKELQEHIAKEFLLVSQVPILRYARQTWQGNRLFFPERNATMSAFSDATIIVEAGDTSGTLIQARAALKQRRKLFILDSCFNNPNISWPATYEKRGAIRVRDLDDILTHLDAPTCQD